MLRMASAAGPDPRSLGAFGGGAPFARCRRMSSSAECFTSCRLSVNAFRAASAAARSSVVPAWASQTHTCRPTCAFIVTSAPSASPSSPAPAYGDAHRRRHIAARKRAPRARAAARPPGATRTGPRVTQGPAPIAHCAPSNNPPPAPLHPPPLSPHPQRHRQRRPRTRAHASPARTRPHQNASIGATMSPVVMMYVLLDVRCFQIRIAPSERVRTGAIDCRVCACAGPSAHASNCDVS